MEDQDTTIQETPQVETEGTTEQGKTAKMYTQEEFAKMQSTFEKKARQAERESKEAKGERDSIRSEVTSLQGQLSSISAEIQRRELEGLDDLPQGRKIASLLETARKKEADLLRKEQDLRQMESTALEGLKFKDALAISKEYGIDVDDLMECTSMTEMYKKTLQLTREKTTPIKKAEVKVPGHIDSGISTSTGKGRIWKASEIINMSSDERFENRSEIARANKEGRIDNTK